MNVRLLATALWVLSFPISASAQTPDLATIARSSGTPDIPGLKMVWLNAAFGGKFPISWSLSIIGAVLAVSILVSVAARRFGRTGTPAG